MRKPFVSSIMRVLTIQSLIFTAVLLGLLSTPTSFTTALKLNGTTTTTTTTPNTPGVNGESAESELPTTVASFLQPDISETTLIPQRQLSSQETDELTATPLNNAGSSSPLAKSQGNIDASESFSTESDFSRGSRPQRNGTGAATANAADAEEDGEQSASLSSSAGQTTAELLTDDEVDNVVPNTTDRDDSAGEAVSTSANSLGNLEDGDSLSFEKDESDTFSAADDDDNVAGGGEVGDTIFPPEENDRLESDESGASTTFASLVRPSPSVNPQTLLSNKMNKNGSGRIGTRGLSSKSVLNAISLSASANNNSNSNNDSNKANSGDSNSNASEVTTVRENSDNDKDRDSNFSSNNFDLNGSTFYSRSNADHHPTIHPRQRLQPEQSLRARPTSPVINHSSNNHNNNLHNRIIKRKRISLGRDSSNTTGGSSLSSIYGNSILTSTVSSKAGEEEVSAPRNAERASTAVKNYSSASTLPTTASSADSLQPATGLDITTESNSLLNASHDRYSQATHYQRSSPPSISGGDESSRKNLTIPVTPLIHSSNDTTNNNASAPLSSSRAILGFGTSSLASAAGKVKRPKPIIMRDHEDSLYNNNVSENAAGTTYENLNNSSAGATPTVSSASQSGFGVVDETATFGIPTGIVDEESNKPVGSNALPTPPYKVRRVKLNSRRTSPRPITEYTSSFITTEAPATTQGLLSVNNTRTRLTADAPAALDYRPMQSNVIRPSSVSSNERPIITSRRVFKEEFGITHNAYNNDHEDDDHHQDNDDDLLGTTEFFSQDSSTPAYPIPMGVRHAPTESEDDTEETEPFHGKIVANNYNRNSGGGDNVNNNNRYRDYYSQIRFPTGTSDYGNEGGNLHFVSDSPDLSSVSSVTVTVTHTVVHTTPRIVPTSTFNVAGNDEESSSTNGDSYHDRPYRDSENGEVAEKESHPNVHPTPALPPSIFASPTASVKSTFNDGEGPPISVSHSVEDVHVSTSRVGVHSVGLHSSQHAENDHNDQHDDKGNDQEHKQEHNGQHNEDNHPNYSSSSVIPYPIQPTPVVTTKAMKSVYSTEVKHPHFSSSSYEFTTSSMYSYTFPDHDSMHMTDHDDEDDHTEHHPEDGVSEEHEHPSSPQPEHSPEVNDTVANDTAATATTSFVTSLYGKYFTTSPSVPQFWDGVGSTKSSTSQSPTTLQPEIAEGASTPTIDIDIYPPVGTEPSSKTEGTTTETPTTTTSRPSVVETTTNQIQIPGSLEDNNLSEEELKKQQPTTTLKPPKSSGEDVSESDKNKSEEASSSGGVGDISHNGVADNDDDHQKTKEHEGGGVNFESGDKNDNASTADKASNEITTTLADEKTPFGIGESFGIGTVHVLIMVQMDLDVSQTVFCAHLTNFKAMIVTVYETQKNVNVSPDQIVFYTKLACDSKSTKDSTEDHNETGGDEKIHKPELTSSTRKPGASSTGKLSDRTTKGTVPLTSPPSTTSQFRRNEDGTRKSRTGKDFNTAKNLTVSDTTSSTLNKNFDEISSSSNKSVTGENALLNKSFAQPLITRSRRSTKMAASPAVTKNANMSEDNKASVGNMSSADDDSLLSVYFYLNNKNGSYDQELTSNFIRLWNDSSRLTSTSNTSSGENNNAGNGQSDSNHSNDDMFFKRVKKVGMITASHLISPQDSSDENSGIIVAITVASIVAVCLFLLGVGLLIMRHRQSQTKFAKRCTPVTLDDYSLDNISVYNSFRRKQRLRGSKRSYTNAAFDDANAPSKPLNASALATALTEISALESEFRAIPNVTATLDDIPNGAETKNRYANVIPMPDTRVLLTFQEDIPNSDYINANYVRGVNGEQKRYIITQGPLEDTVVDFWSLVWQQQVRVILMLTDFAEGGIAKCAEYYPRSETIDCSQLHGDFQITLEKRDISDNCITSYLVLKDMERNLRRDIIHFWYHSWPEKGVPGSPKKTIDFLNRSRKFTKEPTPVLVHCSPGTGRSGTIVACDIGMKEYDSHNKVDIPRLVMKIRQDRAGAVQTKEQYVHIYEVLHSYASRIGATQLESI